MFPHTTCMLWNINNSRTKWQQGCTMDEVDGDASDKVDTECQQERWVQMNNVEFPVRYSVSKKIGTQVSKH